MAHRKFAILLVLLVELVLSSQAKAWLAKEEETPNFQSASIDTIRKTVCGIPFGHVVYKAGQADDSTLFLITYPESMGDYSGWILWLGSADDLRPEAAVDVQRYRDGGSTVVRTPHHVVFIKNGNAGGDLPSSLDDKPLLRIF